MASDSSVDDRGTKSSNHSIIELRAVVNDLTRNSQELLTEKLFLENEVNQLKKRVSRLDDEIRVLKEPPFIVGFIQTKINNLFCIKFIYINLFFERIFYFNNLFFIN